MLKNDKNFEKANQYFKDGSELYINFFERYLQYGHKFFLERALSKYYEKHNRYPRTILDVGCGTGVGLSYLSERLPDAKIVGIDPSEAMLAKCFIYNSNIRIFCTDLEKFISAENQFDLILSHSNFRFWLNAQNELIKINKLLSYTGLFYLLDLRKDCSVELLDEICNGLTDELEKKFMREQFSASYTLQEVKEMIINSEIVNMQLLPGVPELYEENQSNFFASLNDNEYMAKTLMDLSKGFKNTRGLETIFHITLCKDK